MGAISQIQLHYSEMFIYFPIVPLCAVAYFSILMPIMVKLIIDCGNSKLATIKIFYIEIIIKKLQGIVCRFYKFTILI